MLSDDWEKKHRNVHEKTSYFITRHNFKYISCFSDSDIVADKGGGGDERIMIRDFEV